VSTFFERVGGTAIFEKLTKEFYVGVASDPLLKPMYPEQDLGPAERRLKQFLEQYWGGPDTYSQERGHPRLRMRHHAFKVSPKARDAWLHHMKHAVGTLGLSRLDEAELWEYLERAAHSLLNTFED
jgi:hemoglobin